MAGEPASQLQRAREALGLPAAWTALRSADACCYRRPRPCFSPSRTICLPPSVVRVSRPAHPVVAPRPTPEEHPPAKVGTARPARLRTRDTTAWRPWSCLHRDSRPASAALPSSLLFPSACSARDASAVPIHHHRREIHPPFSSDLVKSTTPGLRPHSTGPPLHDSHDPANSLDTLHRIFKRYQPRPLVRPSIARTPAQSSFATVCTRKITTAFSLTIVTCINAHRLPKRNSPRLGWVWTPDDHHSLHLPTSAAPWTTRVDLEPKSQRTSLRRPTKRATRFLKTGVQSPSVLTEAL